MPTPIKFMVTQKQAAKLKSPNLRAIIQVRATGGEPAKRYHAMLVEITPEGNGPYISKDYSDLVGGGLKTNAQAAYDVELRETLDGWGNSDMTGRPELRDECVRLFGSRFAGVFAPSESVKLTSQTPYSIVNTEESPGVHWVAHLFDPDDPSEDVVYDPLGRGESVKTNPDQEQPDNDEDCGQRCVAFLKLVEAQGLDVGVQV